MRYLWITPIIGTILILIESFLNLSSILNASIGIGISIIVIISLLLNQKDVYGTTIVLLICSYFLLLSPFGFGYTWDLGVLLILLGSLFIAEGGFFTAVNFFIYLGIGAVVVDLIIFFV
ncbi:MAG: hypothetical protein HWN65_23340 [Candidatus Helarchaeota archaeon]|nr:hypothetical protein [Candidatus Helarchaeota archaeon]